MTKDQRRHLLTLCRKIEIETDENTFLGLVRELRPLLEIHQRASLRANAQIEVNAHRAIYNPYLVLAANPRFPNS